MNKESSKMPRSSRRRGTSLLAGLLEGKAAQFDGRIVAGSPSSDPRR